MERIRGLTLLEVMLAIGVVAVAILGLLGLFGSGLRLLRNSNQMSQANEIANEVLEESRSLGDIPVGVSFDGAANQPPDAATGFPPAPYPSLSVDGQRYDIKVTTAADPAGVAVLVEVAWAAQSRVRLESLLQP